MCKNARWIFNPHTKTSVYVSCRKCEECLQSKANSITNRIRLHSSMAASFGYIAVMVTLTYNRQSVPYVKKSDISKIVDDFSLSEHSFFTQNVELPVYRKFKDKYNNFIEKQIDAIRLNKVSSTKDNSSSFRFTQIDTVRSGLNTCSDKYNPGCINVSYYKDFQNFYDLLIKKLQRHHGYFKKIHYFVCSEYGETFFRPHFHVLLFIPAKDYELLRNTILETWTYADKFVLDRGIEIARNAASYVSSYVCGNMDLSNFLTVYFPAKSRYSQRFGHNCQFFNYKFFENAANSHDFSFIVPPNKVFTKGYTGTVPTYVINRLFPKFPGLFRITDSEIIDLISGNQRLSKFYNNDEPTVNILNTFIVRLKNAIRFYISETRNTVYDYAILYTRVYRSYKSYLIKKCFENVPASEVFYVYQNLLDYFTSKVKPLAPLPVPSRVFNLISQKDKPLGEVCNYSYFPTQINKSNSLTSLFYKKKKRRKISEVFYIN